MAFSLYLYTIIYILLLFSNEVHHVKGGNNHTKAYSCPPSSCGHLHDIHYPFRLKTDPPQCGSTRFELLCNANEPYLHWQSGKFYVMSISYSDQKINVIDPALMNQTCNPATYTLSLDLLFSGPFVRCDELESFHYPPRASFVSCSRRINKSWYHSCRTEENSLLYVMDGDAKMISLEPSCRRLSSTYISESIGDLKSSEEVLHTLGKGFNLCWFKKSFWKSLGFCFQETIR
jgi:Wall-associated receptor kinase galacturonan-binding